MNTNEMLTQIDMHALSQQMQDGTLTSVALTLSMLDRIARHDKLINAFIYVDVEGALQAARDSDERRAKGLSRGVLDGMPFAAKDTFDIAGMPGTSGSDVHAGRIPEKTAPSVANLMAAGAVCLGKLNTWEYGTGNGGISFDLPNPPALNPRNITRFASGSSTGAGAAVAAGFVAFAVGSDTGGSIRLPAASCGVTGLKPAFGAISREGMMPNADSLDVAGPLTRSPRDAILVAAIMEGVTPPASTPAPLTIGVPALGPSVDPELASAVSRAAAHLESLGHTIVTAELPLPLNRYRAVTGIVNNGECARRHPDLADNPKLGTAVREKLWRGLAISDETLAAAQELMVVFRERTDRVFDTIDVLLLPVTSDLAPVITDPQATREFTREAFTHPFNLTGHPAMTVPQGPASHNLALSVQLVARDVTTFAPLADALVQAFPTPFPDLSYPMEWPKTRDEINAEAAKLVDWLNEVIEEAKSPI